jgi:hypothetical protein
MHGADSQSPQFERKQSEHPLAYLGSAREEPHNTATTVGQFVDAGGTFHVHGTTVQVYRIDWSDGTYLLSRSPSHFEFNTNSLGQVVATEVQQDPGILYSPHGQAIGRLTVFTLSHLTWRDTNGNGQPDPGEITADVDQFRVNC